LCGWCVVIMKINRERARSESAQIDSQHLSADFQDPLPELPRLQQ
jgi:hypothetical protein